MVMRRGFSLIEVLIAMTLLSVALLGVAGSAAMASQVLRQAQMRERSTLEALQIIDSLTREPQPVPGQRLIGNLTLRWVVTRSSNGTDAIDLTVEYLEGNAIRSVRFRAAH
jgi:prepilin-type N-terminal cleavage/methylation domain-containing protein